MPIVGPVPNSQQQRPGASLGAEGSKLAAEIAKVGGMIQTTLSQLEASFKAAAGKATPPPGAAPISEIVAKMAFAAILHDASEKAMGGKAFNLETAINDLWTKLDTLRGVARMASKTAAMAAKGVAATAAHDLEMEKLKRMVEKRSQMFEQLSQIMKAHDQAAKNVIQNMR